MSAVIQNRILMLCAGVLLTACGSDSDGGPSTPAPLDGGGDTGGAAGSAGGAGDVAVMQDASMVVDSGMHTMPQPDSGIVPMMDAMTFMDASQDAAPDAEPDDSLRPWPTDDAVVEVDGAGAFGTDVSGITYEAAGAGPGVIWAAMNLSPTKLYRLEKSGATWQRSTTNSWDNGKTLLFPDGVGIPDSEGVTQAELGSPIVYVGSERNLQGANAGASRMSVLSYDTSAAGASLTAQREWNLTGSLPAASSNQGIEAVTWIPDTALVGLGDTSTDATYDPTVYPIHGTGLFVVGVESQSKVFLFALGSDSAHVLIATAETGLQGVMGL